VTEISPSITDDEVLDRANANRSLLVTGDKDFGELIFRLHRVTHGVILIRLPGLSPQLKAVIVSEAIRVHGDDMLHAFTVISPGMVRIRRNL
jgi:predicted nuclease of predicted toxin-antitoxin system